jgi:hypothetical protein
MGTSRARCAIFDALMSIRIAPLARKLGKMQRA